MTTGKAQLLWMFLVMLLTLTGVITTTTTTMWDVMQTASLMVVMITLAEMSERLIKNGKI